MGRPYPGHQVAVVDEDGKVLSPGELGATAAAYRGDWFLTGDLGTQDEEGWIYYKGRAET